MKCSNLIDFSKPNSIGELLGFNVGEIYPPNVRHISDGLVNISSANCIYIESNLITGSFHNGEQCHTIHEFYPNVPPGFKIIEIPRHLVFYSLNCTTISSARLVLRDNRRELIDLRNEPITVRLLIKTREDLNRRRRRHCDNNGVNIS